VCELARRLWRLVGTLRLAPPLVSISACQHASGLRPSLSAKGLRKPGRWLAPCDLEIETV
jgi:hypothetical protein